jgi:hypothetical protein
MPNEKQRTEAFEMEFLTRYRSTSSKKTFVVRLGDDVILTEEEFAELAQEILDGYFYRPDLIDASEFHYDDTKQVARNHAGKAGPTPGFVYLLQGGEKYWKIGRAKNVDARLAQIQPATPFVTQLVYSFPADDAAEAEKRLHHRYSDQRANGEWFLLTSKQTHEILDIAEYKDGSFRDAGGAKTK